MIDDELRRRLQVLEDRVAICELKAEYLAACDAKDPRRVRACFADGPVEIDYGAVGCFDRADALVEVFTRLGCHPHMVEIHQGFNPRIECIGGDAAQGHWGLHYQLIDTRERRLTQLAGYYEDRYGRAADGRWKITASRSVITSTLVLVLGEETMAALVVGRPS